MFVFPMAGLSQRFVNAGYKLPKYMLPLGDGTVFDLVLRGFSHYFSSDAFLFVCRDVANTAEFVAHQCEMLGIENFQVVMLDDPTRGQAETVALGLRQARVLAETPVTIFNVDTLHQDFKFPTQAFLSDVDGYLEVFRAPGEAWSFVRTKSDEDITVVETAEKKRISDLCSTGLYYFRRASDFLDAYDAEAQKPPSEWQAQELYVAPLYNYLINMGAKIIAAEVPLQEIVPCGTPAEYVAIKDKIG